jgi:hypothetical protein
MLSQGGSFPFYQFNRKKDDNLSKFIDVYWT